MTKRMDEEKICGLHACRALFLRRPQDLRKVYLDSVRVNDVKDMLRYCAQQSIAYKVVTAGDLEKIAKSVHHEGIVCLAQSVTPDTLPEMRRRWTQRLASNKTGACILLLENIRDPHNVGAIIRSAAHFGVDTILTYGETSKRNPALLRTAEGGAEYVDWYEITDLSETLRVLREMGFVCAATSSHASDSLYEGTLPPRTIFLLGAEREGLSAQLQNEAEIRIAIPGSGVVESLNVASASSVLLAEFQRQKRAGGPQKSQPRKKTKGQSPQARSAGKNALRHTGKSRQTLGSGGLGHPKPKPTKRGSSQ